jgi:hypothetical protein
MTAASPAAVEFFGRQLAMHLRSARRIQAVTINQYISHCVTGLREVGWANAPYLRSNLLNTILKGWLRADIAACPKRLKSSIPATAAVMQEFFTFTDTLLADNPRRRLEIKACGALTYYMALRANEGAAKSPHARDATGADHDTPDAHHLLARHVHLRFPDDDTFYPATSGVAFPQGLSPTSIDALQDSTKNTLQRGSQHRGAHPNPRADKQPFCVVAIVWEYVRAYPPLFGGAFFPTITSADVSAILQQVAALPHVGLDPARLSMRCLRSGSATMLRNLKNQLVDQHDLAQIQQHGQWAGDVGARVYAHAAPDAQRLLVPPSMYDSGFMGLSYLRWFYMSPA